MADEDKSGRILKILKQITENLTQDEIISLRTNIKTAIDLSKGPMHDETQLKEFLGKYVKMLQFRSGISVNLLKQSIRSLIMISENEDLGNIIYEKFNDYILREHPTLSIGIDLDDDLLKAYFKALEAGSEEARHIRLMVVGMYGVGKTTLVNNLLCKPDKEPPSTVGIDISVDACEVDEDEKWTMTQDLEKREKRYKMRLQELFKKNAEKESAKVTIYPRQVTQVFTNPDHGSEEDMPIEAEEEDVPMPEEMNLDVGDYTDYISKAKYEYREAEQHGVPEESNYFKDMKTAHEKSKEEEMKMKPTTVSIWDFAGQSVYYSTHHFFLNPRAIYLLVLDLSKPLNGKVDEGISMSGNKNLHIGNSATEHFTRLDAFHFWLKSIYMYTQERKYSNSAESGKNKYMPIIILIGTHKDAFNREERDLDEIKNEYFENALKPFKYSDVLSMIHKKTFFVSKYGPPEEFEAVKAEIYKVAREKRKLFLEEEIPGKFIPLEREVDRKKTDKKELMHVTDLTEVSEGSHLPLSEEEVRLFLKFQHAFGNLLHYQAANPDMIILKPQWIINAFKIFVTHKETNNSKEWEEFISMGKLTDNLIDERLKSEDDRLSKEKDGEERERESWFSFKEQILKYMEHLDIIAKPVSFEEEEEEEEEENMDVENCQQTSKEWRMPNKVRIRSFYFMPCMLPSRPSKDILREMLYTSEGVSSQLLCMYIKGVFLPPFVFHRLMATCIKKMPILVYQDKYVLFNGIGAFMLDSTTILTIWSWDNIIYFKVTSSHRDCGNIMENANLVSLRDDFDRLVKSAFNTDENVYSAKVEICYYVTCPKCPERFPFDLKTDEDGYPIDQKCELILVEDMLLTDEKICNPNKHHVTREDVLEKWFKVKHSEAIVDIDPRLLTECEDEDILADLADEIEPEKINVLAEALNITHKELQRIRYNHGKSALRFIFHILYQWQKSSQSLAILKEAVAKAGCDENDFFRVLDRKEIEKKEKKIKEIKHSLNYEHIKGMTFDECLCTNISKYVGEEYWLLGIRLGIAVADMQHMHENNEGNAENMTKDILLRWLSSGGNQTELVDSLVKAMVKSDCKLQCFKNIFGK